MATDYCLVDFEPPGLRVAVRAGDTLLEAALRAGINLWASCGGQGTCGQCSVVVVSGSVSAVVQDEFEFLTQAELENKRRLACCVRVFGPVKVTIPLSSFVASRPRI